MAYTFEFISKVQIDPAEAGNTESSETTFKCEKFLYYARCYQGILQYVKGEAPEDYKNWPIPPTELEIEGHEFRRKEFNRDHTIIQSWLDTL